MLRLLVSVKVLTNQANQANTKIISCNGRPIRVCADQFGRSPQSTFNCEGLFQLACKTSLNKGYEDAVDDTETGESADGKSVAPVELHYAIPAECGCANIELNGDEEGEEEDCSASVAGSKYQVTYSDSSCIQRTFDPSAYANCDAATDSYTTCSVTFDADSADSSFPEDQDNSESGSADTESKSKDEEEPSTSQVAQETAASSTAGSSSANSPHFTIRSLLTLVIVTALALQ